MRYLSKITEVVEEGDGPSKTDLSESKVLIIDDENMVAQMYKDWLSNTGCSVEVANGGEEALKKVDREVDLVFLDRRMPVITGDEVLNLLRSDDIDELDPESFEGHDSYRITQEYEEKNITDVDLDTLKKLDDETVGNLQEEDIDCAVCMVTAVNPDFDIVAMGFDHYVVKTIDRNRLMEIVEALSSLPELDDEVREYQSLRWKRFLLREALSDQELDENEDYRRLEDRMEEIEEGSGEQVQKVKEIEFS